MQQKIKTYLKQFLKQTKFYHQLVQVSDVLKVCIEIVDICGVIKEMHAESRVAEVRGNDKKISEHLGFYQKSFQARNALFWG